MQGFVPGERGVGYKLLTRDGGRVESPVSGGRDLHPVDEAPPGHDDAGDVACCGVSVRVPQEESGLENPEKTHGYTLPTRTAEWGVSRVNRSYGLRPDRTQRLPPT